MALLDVLSQHFPLAEGRRQLQYFRAAVSALPQAVGGEVPYEQWVQLTKSLPLEGYAR